ncbi:MAG: HD domain-containing protein [Bdellovibrionaceae bacterium]|nr:HD domain-containing protein [Pseudobdellovibrionaceae bacterium]
MNLSQFEKILSDKIFEIASSGDPAHDFSHFRRVVQSAKNLCFLENARIEVVMPSAWLHDFVFIPKNDPRRALASRLSALAAIDFLKEIQYPEIYFKDISNAIEAHSFSGGIEPLTIEAQVVQDADRLDALGAIGIARCFATAGLVKRSFYSKIDPFCVNRLPDDNQFTIDHFYKKLFLVAETLKTEAGRLEGAKRVLVMKKYLLDLKNEI